MADKKVDNIDDLVKIIVAKFQYKLMPNEVIIIVDSQKEEIQFKDDEDFISYFDKTKVFNFRRVPIGMGKQVQKVSKQEKIEVE